MKCENEKCDIYFHVECARINKFHLENMYFEDGLKYFIYCQTHRPLQFLKTIEIKNNKKREDILKYAELLQKNLDLFLKSNNKQPLSLFTKTYSLEKSGANYLKFLNKKRTKMSQIANDSHETELSKVQVQKIYSKIKEVHSKVSSLDVMIKYREKAKKYEVVKNFVSNYIQFPDTFDKSKFPWYMINIPGISVKAAYNIYGKTINNNVDFEKLILNKINDPRLNVPFPEYSPNSFFYNQVIIENNSNKKLKRKKKLGKYNRKSLPFPHIPLHPYNLNGGVVGLGGQLLPIQNLNMTVNYNPQFSTVNTIVESNHSNNIIEHPQNLNSFSFCFSNSNMTKNPSSTQIPPHINPDVRQVIPPPTNTHNPVTIYCICKKHYDDSFMVACSNEADCKYGGWFHPYCIKELQCMTEEELNSESFDYTCRDCQAKLKKKEKTQEQIERENELEKEKETKEKRKNRHLNRQSKEDFKILNNLKTKGVYNSNIVNEDEEEEALDGNEEKFTLNFKNKESETNLDEYILEEREKNKIDSFHSPNTSFNYSKNGRESQTIKSFKQQSKTKISSSESNNDKSNDKRNGTGKHSKKKIILNNIEEKEIEETTPKKGVNLFLITRSSGKLSIKETEITDYFKISKTKSERESNLSKNSTTSKMIKETEQK